MAKKYNNIEDLPFVELSKDQLNEDIDLSKEFDMQVWGIKGKGWNVYCGGGLDGVAGILFCEPNELLESPFMYDEYEIVWEDETIEQDSITQEELLTLINK